MSAAQAAAEVLGLSPKDPHIFTPDARFDCLICGEGPMDVRHVLARRLKLDVAAVRAALERGGPAADAATGIIEALCDSVEALQTENGRLQQRLRLAKDS